MSTLDRPEVRIVALLLNIAALFLWVWRNPYAARAVEARSLYDRAVEADRAKDLATAYDLYRGVVAAHPESRWAREARYQIGRIAMDEVGDLDAAREAFAAYLATESGSASARRRLDLLEAIRDEDDETGRRIVGVFLLAEADRWSEAARLAARIPDDRIGAAGRDAVAGLLRGRS